MKQGRFAHVPESLIEDLDKQLDNDWELLLRKEQMTNEILGEGSEE